jgi:hypothetical protein
MLMYARLPNTASAHEVAHGINFGRRMEVG